MTIRHVILEADAPESVCFLLTAYIEATRFYVNRLQFLAWEKQRQLATIDV